MAIAKGNTPYLGRAWRISVTTEGGDTFVLSSSKMETPLRTVFTITRMVNVVFWEAEIKIYNLNDKALAFFNPNSLNLNSPFFDLGTGISVSAGYQYSSTGLFAPESNQLYNGVIFQPIWTRENVIDSCLTLHCLVGLHADSFNFVNRSIRPGNSYDVAAAVAADAGLKLKVSNSDKQTLEN